MTNTQELQRIANSLVTNGKGILAIDESTPTCNGRFEALGIGTTEDKRREYRELLVSGDGLSDYIGGAILFDETIRHTMADGVAFPDLMADSGIIPGIKVDTGAKQLAGFEGELVTEGLDGLRDRLAEYFSMGARFAKWRAVIRISDGLPTSGAIKANAHALARYAALCQEAAIVPIVEPEVLMDGAHSIDVCAEVTARTLATVFEQLDEQGVALEGIILKPSMVISGADNSDRAGRAEVAERTLECLRHNVPAAVPAVAFLSGGQGDTEATEHLDLMNRLDTELPWELTFSYGRALQRAAIEIWRGDTDKVPEAKAALLERARLSSLAARGQYSDHV